MAELIMKIKKVEFQHKLTLCGVALGTVLLSQAFSCVAAPAEKAALSVSAEGAGFGMVAQRQFAPQNLRGYGTVSGTLWQLKKAGAASILEIDCQSVAKAQLVQAKYLSDLELLSGTVKIELPSKIAAREVAGQGAIAAVRDGATVWIAAATSREALGELVQNGFKGDKTQLVSNPEVTVPMWLDRWDKHGWRFYYRPFDVPQDLPRADWPQYDFTAEFDWLKQTDSGLVFWDKPSPIDNSEGLNTRSWWDWAYKAAKARNLPVGINATIEDQIWISNRYRDQTQQAMPQFVGSYYGVTDPNGGGQGFVSWNATTAKDAQLGQAQQSVLRLASDENVTSWLEPHGEMYRGGHEIFTEYGPVADAGFREFLRGKYQNLDAVNARWKTQAKSWDEVRVPEVASFLGWGAQAIDLSGTWRAGYLAAPTDDKFTTRRTAMKTIDDVPLPDEWFQPAFDDSKWPTVQAPGDDATMFLPTRSAVYRRSFEVPADWKAKNPRAWLYVWDLNRGKNQLVSARLNGQKVGDSPISNDPHWDAFEVTDALRAGKNELSLGLPQGFLAYRVYLSPDAPLQYPQLGECQKRVVGGFHRLDALVARSTRCGAAWK